MPDSIRTIVLGVASLAADDPGTGHVDPALASAAALARSLGARLHAVHVFELPAPALAGVDLPPPGPELRDVALAGVTRRLNEHAALFPDIDIVCHAIEGSPALALVDMATRLDADLLVVGATRRGRYWRGILGSTAEGVLRAAAGPVLVLHQPLEVPVGRVLLTTDLSEESVELLRRGMRTVRALVRPGSAAGIELLVVVAFDPMVPPPHPEAELLARAEHDLQSVAADVGFGIDVRARSGEPAVEISREAEEWKADLIVLGTHGRSGYRPSWLGSTATAAARAVSCNVLAIPGAPVRVRGETAVPVVRLVDRVPLLA